MASHHPAEHLDPRGRRSAAEHGLHARRRALHHPFHSLIHRMVLFRLSRKGESRRELPLMTAGGRPERRLWPRRIGWLVLIWAMSVIGSGIVAALTRVLMEFAGLTNQAS